MLKHFDHMQMVGYFFFKFMTESGIKKGKKGGYRYSRICPVAGCRSRPQKKLGQRIQYKHPELLAKKQQLLRVAKRVLHRPRALPPCTNANQPTLKQVLQKAHTPHDVHSYPDEDQEQLLEVEERGSRM